LGQDTRAIGRSRIGIGVATVGEVGKGGQGVLEDGMALAAPGVGHEPHAATIMFD
jgi:hypothetical protein